jgi:hypothetical protein
MKIQRIGCVEHGIDGWDDYILVKTQDVINLDEVRDFMEESHYCDGSGLYFCNSLKVIRDGDYSAIVIVYHRADV